MQSTGDESGTRPAPADETGGPAPLRLLRLWFGFTERVDRRAYALSGAALMAIKYAVDAGLFYALTGSLWSPLDYLAPFHAERNVGLRGAPNWAWLVSALWTLPFVWIGVSMSMRRAIDAGTSPWLSLLFFVPLVNYLLMLGLCVPTSKAGAWNRARERATRGRSPAADALSLLGEALATMAVSAVLLAGLVFFAASGARSYGASLFLGAPILLGVVAGYLPNRKQLHSRRASLVIAYASVLLTAGFLVLFALEGLVCIVMMAALALPMVFVGVVIGYALAQIGKPSSGPIAFSLAALPLLVLLESNVAPSGPIEVATSIEIDVPPERVWQNVVSFSELPAPEHWLFATGIAYPVRARIEGEGVGAVRYCEFSTGAFVEPITHWDAPRRLAFDVARQPQPMEEWSFYEDLHPPHLDGYFRSVRGEFRLVPLAGGRTRLEGSTWYELELRPVLYWRQLADAIVHRIHGRVLRHVRDLSERAGS